MKLLDYFNKKILLFLLPVFISGMPSVINMEKNVHSYSITENSKKKVLKEESLKAKPREIRVNIALDGVSKEYSEKLLDYVSEKYKKEFNISFNAVDFYTHNLPERWRTDLEMEKMKKASRKKSDVYFLFTNTDWDNESDSGNYSVVGEAHEKLGYA